MNLRVDYQKCSKSGECYYNHPELFRKGDDQFPVVLQPHVPPALEWEAQGAADVCPVQAVIVGDGDRAPEAE